MGIPKPLVQINQLFIVVTALVGLLISPYILFLPLMNGIITLATKQNPVIKMSRGLLKKSSDSYVQEDKDQQLFNQWIATICLAIAVISFFLGASIVGYVFGGMVIFAAGLALCGYCIGCTIRYRYMMWKYKRINS
ncbi:DUF4395 domain-containing protein [Bacillus suaedaesalsae]|uniref:DUF4395 domain-containing protein n=1 Tax=Bacillus suaedaesalsae TaxID=2810349 RepID=A0ABS2DCS1_9BACI|nr:DUF4395 domain-containing protein [Bacillus suaedaesalsae]MBM6616267.1 DUF4395 domain-containing protein [Bacillus suaedaesalsae]